MGRTMILVMDTLTLRSLYELIKYLRYVDVLWHVFMFSNYKFYLHKKICVVLAYLPKSITHVKIGLKIKPPLI
jgi:hypothetical protein